MELQEQAAALEEPQEQAELELHQQQLEELEELEQVELPWRSWQQAHLQLDLHLLSWSSRRSRFEWRSEWSIRAGTAGAGGGARNWQLELRLVEQQPEAAAGGASGSWSFTSSWSWSSREQEQAGGVVEPQSRELPQEPQEQQLELEPHREPHPLYPPQFRQERQEEPEHHHF